jgi:hypothetical protein
MGRGLVSLVLALSLGSSATTRLYPYDPNYPNYLMHIRALYWLNARWDIESPGSIEVRKGD